MRLRVHFFTFVILWFGFFLSDNFANAIWLLSIAGLISGAIPFILGGIRIGSITMLLALIGIVGNGYVAWFLFMLHRMS